MSAGLFLTRSAGAAALLVAVGCTACTGAASNITAEGSRYPVSMSRAVRDSDGTLVPAERRETVGSVKIERTGWSLFYSAIDLTDMDISDAINEQVAARSADAVTHLTIVTSHCTLNYFSFPMALLPFWPGCVDVSITGNIIKVSQPPPNPAVTASAHGGAP